MQKCRQVPSFSKEEIFDTLIQQAFASFEFPCMWSNDDLKEEIITLRAEDLADYMRKQEMVDYSIISLDSNEMSEDLDGLMSLCAETSLHKWLDKYEYTHL